MSRRLWSGLFAAVFCGAVTVAAAQEPQTGQSSAASGKSMTVTGCVQRADTASAATTGTSGSSAADQTKFVLKNATASSASSSTAGTAGSASETGAMASEYRLDGDDAKLSPHVGHKVEITGTVAKPSAASQPSAAASPKLKVDSVKMVSTTCP